MTLFSFNPQRACNVDFYFDKIDAIRDEDLGKLNNILESEGINQILKDYFEGLIERYNDFQEDARNTFGTEMDATYEVTKPLPVREGPIGPQVDISADRYLPGGEDQLEIRVAPRERMDYLKLIDSSEVN